MRAFENIFEEDKMKRIIVFALVVLMAVSVFGCSIKTADKQDGKTTQAPTDNPAASNEPQAQTDKPVETETISSDEPVEESNEPSDAPTGEATIEETVVYDDNGLKITAKSLDMDGLFGPEIKFLIENESGKALTVQSRNVSVNDYMVDTIMSADIADGKKANEDLTITSSSLKNSGITQIADIELSFHIFESNDWLKSYDSDMIKISTSIAGEYEYSFNEEGTVLFDENNIKIVSKGVNEDAFLGKEILLYIANNTDESITVQVRDVSINGCMMNAIFSCELNPGKHAVDGITFLDSELEENSIETIENVELSFNVFNSDNYDGIVDSQPITIEF